MQVVDELYSLPMIGPETLRASCTILFYSVHWVLLQHGGKLRGPNQEPDSCVTDGCFVAILPLYTQDEMVLTRLQTLTLHSYALVLLRQRSEALRISAMANTKALECGLHHDGPASRGNPLETEMRRRVFWCVFMIRKSGSWVASIKSHLLISS